jgi:hypothetical protein
MRIDVINHRKKKHQDGFVDYYDSEKLTKKLAPCFYYPMTDTPSSKGRPYDVSFKMKRLVFCFSAHPSNQINKDLFDIPTSDIRFFDLDYDNPRNPHGSCIVLPIVLDCLRLFDEHQKHYLPQPMIRAGRVSS